MGYQDIGDFGVKNMTMLHFRGNGKNLELENHLNAMSRSYWAIQ